jgi:hypothetical protein
MRNSRRRIRAEQKRNAPAMLETSEGVAAKGLVSMQDHSIPTPITESIPPPVPFGECVERFVADMRALGLHVDVNYTPGMTYRPIVNIELWPERKRVAS